jgi:hypothetical protein
MAQELQGCQPLVQILVVANRVAVQVLTVARWSRPLLPGKNLEVDGRSNG